MVGSGSRSCTYLSKFMRLRSVLWSSFPQKYNWHTAFVLPEVSGVLETLRRADAQCVMESKRAVSSSTHGPCYFNKEQTPLGDLLGPNPRFHGGSFGVYGHTSSEALKM